MVVNRAIVRSWDFGCNGTCVRRCEELDCNIRGDPGIASKWKFILRLSNQISSDADYRKIRKARFE